jgi:cytochrome c556
MPRKWMMITALMASVSVLTIGVSMADDEDSPLHKVMEQVNAKSLAITKGVRTAVAFKKAQKDVAAAAEDLIKLAKQAKELGQDHIKKAKEVPNAGAKWNELMDSFASSSQHLAKVVGSPSAKQEEAKSAHTALKKVCTDCHTVFRIEEE